MLRQNIFTLLKLYYQLFGLRKNMKYGIGRVNVCSIQSQSRHWDFTGIHNALRATTYTPLHIWFVGVCISVRLIVVSWFLRWLCRLRWAWRVTSWPSPTTCSCTTTPNMGAALEDWTLRKEHRPTWNMVLKAGTKHPGSLPDFLCLPHFLSVCSTPLPLPPPLPSLSGSALNPSSVSALSLSNLLSCLLSYLSAASSQILTFLSCKVSKSS